MTFVRKWSSLECFIQCQGVICGSRYASLNLTNLSNIEVLNLATFVVSRNKYKKFTGLPLYDRFNIQLPGAELEELKVLWQEYQS